VVRTVVFDVGETLFDETGLWQRAADAAGVPRFTLLGVLGGLAARGECHARAWEILGLEPGDGGGFEADELYPDARPALDELRARGYRLGAVGNTTARIEPLLRELVDLVGSSERWGVTKPAAAFFARLVEEAGCEPGEIAYVGDRVDNDVDPALAAGLVAVHIRRGPWGYLQDGRQRAHLLIDSLAELPGALAHV
jgi:HAD superfamily hydrolase (TIGR01549 family)